LNAKIAVIFLLSIALLGCVQQPPPGAVPPPATKECIGEGETIPVIAEPPECCAGLELILPKETQILGIMGYCTANCGNGICDAIESENNCPGDCVAEQAVGPEYYGSENEAFAALEEELDSVETASAEELEALLGE